MINNLYNIKKHMPDLQIKLNIYENKKIYIVNIQSVASSSLCNEYVLKYISYFTNGNIKNIPSISYINIDKKDLFKYLFDGFTCLIIDNNIIAFETRASLDRGVTESTSEPTVKGSKDSFNENYNTNIGLIRKRVKDKNLYLDEFSLGDKTNTKIGIMYMNNIVDKSLLKNTIDKIKSINSEKILDSYYIKELIKNENHTSIPTIKSSEKPSTICKVLTEGRICIVVENSNNVLIIPTFFVDYFYNEEDNYKKKSYSIFAKIIRFLALFITIFAPSIYLSLITHDQQMLPTSLFINFSLQRANVPFPALIESLFLMITFELLYEADEITPSSRGTSLSILGALVLGDAAVNAGIVSPIMVIVVAITSISSIFFVYHDFQLFIRTYRYTLMLLASFFGIIGILFGFVFLITNLCSIKSFGKPFLQPYSPFIKKNKNYLIKNALLIQNTDKGEI